MIEEDGMTNYQEMEEQIKGQRVFIEAQVQAIMRQLLMNVGLEEVRRASKIYLVGCGDSWCAAIAARMAFEKHVQIETEALHALEFSRYQLESAPRDALLFAISSSGEVARTVEAARLARQKGLYVIALTRNQESSLAQLGNFTLHVAAPSTGQPMPGVLSYIGSLLGLYVAAVYFSELRRVIDHPEADELYQNIRSVGMQNEQTCQENAALVTLLVDRTVGQGVYQILGSGPNYGTSLYGCMKLLEAAAVPSLCYGIEEWAHAGFFLTTPDTPIILVAPRGNSYDRAMEIARAALAVKATVAVISNEQDQQMASSAGVVFMSVMGPAMEEFTPLGCAVPLQLLALEVARRKKTTPFEFTNSHRQQVNYDQIFRSKQLQSLQDLDGGQS
jgi:glucosamine 6-phosphate synthetase-like amidotransferase/phosphosugar isomerase protein